MFSLNVFVYSTMWKYNLWFGLSVSDDPLASAKLQQIKNTKKQSSSNVATNSQKMENNKICPQQKELKTILHNLKKLRWKWINLQELFVCSTNTNWDSIQYTRQWGSYIYLNMLFEHSLKQLNALISRKYVINYTYTKIKSRIAWIR